MNGDEYFDSEEFRDILSEYEQALRTGMPLFLDTDELCDIADYYQMNDRYEEAELTVLTRPTACCATSCSRHRPTNIRTMW